MIRDQIKKDLTNACQKLGIDPKEVEVERTNDPKFGDFSTNLALQVKAKTNQSTLETAKILTDSLHNLPYVKKLEVVKPGFINFFIKDDVWQNQVSEPLKTGSKFGSNSQGSGKKARVEFVSANPTGPLHFGNARGGPIGDSLASVLEFCGYKVLREYYHNDVGQQVKKLGQSIVNVALGARLQDQEYKGWYVEELARQIKVKDVAQVGSEAVEKMLQIALENCKKLGIKFDEVHIESQFAASGSTKNVIDHLKEKGVIVEKEGARWFAPSDEFLKDRETVVIKSDATFTYFANDIAYHNLKFEDKPDLVVDIFGADHHGHVPRLQAAVKALGHDVSKFRIILYQWVRFKKGEEILKTSKRSGNIVTVADVLEAIGPDAIRFFLLMHDPNSPIDFDLQLAKEKSAKNPVYYVQYAHARICSILKKARGPAVLHPQPTSSPALRALLSEKSLSAFAREELTAGARRGPPSHVTPRKINYKLLTTKYELDLIKQITRLPELVEDIAQNFAVHRLTSYAIELADSFHRFYEHCQVLSEKKGLAFARLALCRATKITLDNTLGLLGVSAPDKM